MSFGRACIYYGGTHLINFYGPAARSAAVSLSIGCVLAGTPSVAFADVIDADLVGTISTPSGERLPGVTVEAAVEPTAEQLSALAAGTEVSPVPIGSAVTDSSGAFKMTVSNPAAIANGRDDEGLVAVVVSAPTAGGQVFYRTRMAVTPAGKLDGYQPDVSAEAVNHHADESQTTDSGDGQVPNLALVTLQVTPNQVVAPKPAEPSESPDCPPPGGGTGFTAPDQAVVPVLDCPQYSDSPDDPSDPDPIEPESSWASQPRTDQPVFDPPQEATTPQPLAQTKASGPARAAAKGFDPDVWCGGNHWYLKKSADTVKLHVTLMSQATGGSTTGEFEYKTTKGTSLEIGVTNKAGSLVSTLGMTKGATHSASIKSKIKKKTKAEWWVSYDFNLLDVWCQSNTTYVKWWSGYTEFRAKGFAGDASRRSWTVFSCQSKYRASLGPGFSATVSDDKTTTRTGAFNIGSGTAGNLKASQTWGSTQTVTYDAIGEASYTLCGNTGKWFAAVTKIRQV